MNDGQGGGNGGAQSGLHGDELNGWDGEVAAGGEDGIDCGASCLEHGELSDALESVPLVAHGGLCLFAGL